MSNCIRELLSSSNKISSKRFITVLAFVLMSIGFLTNLAFDWTIEKYIYDSMSYIVISGLGFTASEWLFRKASPKDKTDTEEI
jgi:hypothetical protein